MMIDRVTKFLLAVIAFALCSIALHSFTPTAAKAEPAVGAPTTFTGVNVPLIATTAPGGGPVFVMDKDYISAYRLTGYGKIVLLDREQWTDLKPKQTAMMPKAVTK